MSTDIFTLKSLKPKTHTVMVQFESEEGPTTFTFKRPGRAGVARIAANIAAAFTSDHAQIREGLDGEGVRMDAVLREYLVIDAGVPKELVGEFMGPNGPTRYINPETTPPSLWAYLGKEAVTFHDSFREVDDQFKPGKREDD